MKLLIKSCLAVALFAGICLAGCKEKDMSMKMNNPRNIRGVISYKRSFGDLNDVQSGYSQENRYPVLSVPVKRRKK